MSLCEPVLPLRRRPATAPSCRPPQAPGAGGAAHVDTRTNPRSGAACVRAFCSGCPVGQWRKTDELCGTVAVAGMRVNVCKFTGDGCRRHGCVVSLRKKGRTCHCGYVACKGARGTSVVSRTGVCSVLHWVRGIACARWCTGRGVLLADGWGDGYATGDMVVMMRHGR